MPTTKASGTQSATTTHTLATITDAGVYQLFLDLNDMVSGDILDVIVEYKVTSGGTTRQMEKFTYLGDTLGSNKVVFSDIYSVVNEIVFKISEVAGGTISVPWEIVQVDG